MRDPRYDILFEPVKIGPVTARNRFYQVPHCNGMGYRDPSGEAYMRRVKAEGGWAVVCTEQVEIHPTSDIGPFIELRLWDDQDLPALARIAEKIHEGGALAGIELAHNGLNSPNLISREAPLGPQNLPVVSWNYDPVQAREMTKADIADMRYWHREAVRRSLQAEYDIVYVYAGHAIGGLHHFLSRRYNNRTDEYGGSIENRARLLREILEDTREVCDGKAAVACRISVDELLGDEGITRAEIEDVIGMLGEHPDLWDFVLGSWEDDSVTSRFGPEAEQEPYVRGLKAADHQTRCGRWPFHFTRHDGAPGQDRCARPDRRRAALHRRSVPAPQDRDRQPRGHPRMHRLQHLRVRRLHDVADPLHPEPHHGRGIPPRLASREDPDRSPATPRCSWSVPARPAWKPPARWVTAATP